MAKEPEGKIETKNEPKGKAAKSVEEAAQLEPYPTGDPQDPEGREAFKAAHGYYPEDYPPAHLAPVPEEPAAAAAKTTTRGDTSFAAKKDK